MIDYTLSFVPNGADDIDSITYNIESADVTLPIPSRTGYTFSGWYTDEAFTSESVATVVSGSYGDVTFYAKWDIVEYKVTFDSANGEAVEEITFTVESDTFALPETTRNGYTFAGWFESADLTGEAAQNIANGTYRDITLYAKWEVVDYTLSFVPNGAADINSITYNIESEDVALPIPSRRGYTFAGWYTDEA